MPKKTTPAAELEGITTTPEQTAPAQAAPGGDTTPAQDAPEPNTTPEPNAGPVPSAGPDPAPVPSAVSEAAAALGRRARGVPKTLTPERREELRAAAAHARGFRAVGRTVPATTPVAPSTPVAPAVGRRVRGVPIPVGRRIQARVVPAGQIVAPTRDEVDTFGAKR